MLIAPPAQKQDDGPRRHEDPGGMSGKPAYRRLHSCINRAPPHAVGGAISSRARPLGSGPIWVTATAAIATITAITTNTAVRPRAVTAVGLRPKRSSEYIMKALAHGKARVIQKIEFSDLAIGKPRSTRMFGNQAPSPSAMPKKAKKQIIPAITRTGYSRNTVAIGSLLVSLAASVRSDASGTVRNPMRANKSRARCP